MKKALLGITASSKKLDVVAESIKSRISWINRQAHQHWGEILLVVAIATVAGIASYQASQLVDPKIFSQQTPFDLWFSSDLPRVFANMTDRWSDHERIKVHPLFSLIAFPLVLLLKTALGIESLMAVRLAIAVISALWIAALFILLRLIGCQIFDATLFSILGGTSAAAMFWFVVPETYSFGSLTIVAALCFVAIAQYRKLSARWYVVVSAMTLSMTTTNWMVGILATFTKYRRKWAWRITVDAFCLTVLLWGVQKYIFPSAVFFIGDRQEKKFILQETSGGFFHVLPSFFAHTIVMPAFQVVARTKTSHWSMLLTQRSLPGSASVWGTIAVILWTALLGLGIWGFFAAKQHRQLRIVIALAILGQLALHTVYGDETFLYSLHFLPLLIVLAAFSTQTPARAIALILAGLLVLTAGVNNSSQFVKATEIIRSQVKMDKQVLRQIPLNSNAPLKTNYPSV